VAACYGKLFKEVVMVVTAGSLGLVKIIGAHRQQFYLL
jgi:hypothetical protein